MSTLLERQRAAKLTDAQLTALGQLCRYGLGWRRQKAWEVGADSVAPATIDALVGRGLVTVRHDIANATPDGQKLHLEIVRGAA